MNYVILAYASIEDIKTMTLWLSGLMTGGITLRLIHDGFTAMEDPDMGLKQMLKKSKKRIAAALIGLTVTSLVAFIKRYY